MIVAAFWPGFYQSLTEYYLLVLFNWDKKNSSNKFSFMDSESELHEEPPDESETPPSAKIDVHANGRVATTAKVIDGSGFKSAIGDLCLP